MNRGTAKALADIAFLSPMIMATRLGMLAVPGSATERETRRMVTEKTAAFSIGYVHAALEWQRQMALGALAMASGGTPRTAEVAGKVAEAALRPVARTVGKNSKRLARRKSR